MHHKCIHLQQGQMFFWIPTHSRPTIHESYLYLRKQDHIQSFLLLLLHLQLLVFWYRLLKMPTLQEQDDAFNLSNIRIGTLDNLRRLWYIGSDSCRRSKARFGRTVRGFYIVLLCNLAVFIIAYICRNDPKFFVFRIRASYNSIICSNESAIVSLSIYCICEGARGFALNPSTAAKAFSFF